MSLRTDRRAPAEAWRLRESDCASREPIDSGGSDDGVEDWSAYGAVEVALRWPAHYQRGRHRPRA
jgi:hypothetical protein